MSKFLALIETVNQRFQKGGFLSGDYIKFKKNFTSHDSFKKLGTNTQEALLNLAKDTDLTKMHLRVVGVKSEYPATTPDNPNNTGNISYADIVQDLGGGRYNQIYTVPIDLIDKIDDYYPSSAPIPDGFKLADRTQIKPEEIKQSEYSNARQNTKLPSKSAKSTEGQYLKDLKK